MGIDSQSIVPGSSSAGICPFGFILRCSGFRVRGTAVGTWSYLTPSSSNAHRLRAALDIDVPCNLIISIPPVVRRGQTYFANSRDSISQLCGSRVNTMPSIALVTARSPSMLFDKMHSDTTRARIALDAFGAHHVFANNRLRDTARRQPGARARRDAPDA